MNIAVYCSASDNINPRWQKASAELGAWIGQSKSTLVYGGVDAGLMHIVATAVKANGGNIIGVVPELRKSMASTFDDHRIDVAGLDERKSMMQQLADVFVALPGGYGTLDELMSAFAYINFNKIDNKRVIICNFDGIYDQLTEQLHKFIEFGLMNPAVLRRLTVVDTSAKLIETLTI